MSAIPLPFTFAHKSSFLHDDESDVSLQIAGAVRFRHQVSAFAQRYPETDLAPNVPRIDWIEKIVFTFRAISRILKPYLAAAGLARSSVLVSTGLNH
jgi:hypothetical protein